MYPPVLLNAKGYQTAYTRTSADDFAEEKPYDPTSFFGRLGNVDQLAWSPDGTYVAYTELLRGGRTRINIVRYNSLGGDIINLTDGSTLDREPSWSSDSEWIVFTSERDGNPEVYIVASSGQSLTNLTQDGSVDMQPAWQPYESVE